MMKIKLYFHKKHKTALKIILSTFKSKLKIDFEVNKTNYKNH